MSIATVTTAEVRTFATARYPDVHDVVRLPGGEWSRAFAFATGDRELVVRFGHHLEDYAKDRFAARWSSERLPVPHVLEIGQAFDGAYAISVRVSGEPIDGLEPDRFHAALPSLMDTLREVRRLELPGSGYGIWRADDGSAPHATWRGYLLAVAHRSDARLAGWREALDALPDAAAAFDAGHAALHELSRAVPEERGVVHEDLLAGNVLIADDRVTAVLDWGNSLAGDPLYDLAWLLYWVRWHTGWDERVIRSAAGDLLDGADVEERLRCYQLHIALAAQQYSAFVGRPAEVTWNADQIRDLLSG
jgi:hygromycin-B 4-O-kinase